MTLVSIQSHASYSTNLACLNALSECFECISMFSCVFKLQNGVNLYTIILLLLQFVVLSQFDL